jgi:hypothetical protein
MYQELTDAINEHVRGFHINGVSDSIEHDNARICNGLRQRSALVYIEEQGRGDRLPQVLW